MEHINKHNKLYNGHIPIGNDKWLVISRVDSFQGDGEGIQLSVFDKELQSTTILGELFHGKWYTPNQTNTNTLWSLLKQYPHPIKRIIHNLKTPLNDLKPFILEWNCFKRRFHLQSIKIKRKLTH
jgi:hypothetical protein